MDYSSFVLAHPFLVGAIYALAINLAAFMAFAWDKRCARNRAWRVPERTLLTLAAAGGSLGAFTAQQALRHKTSKQPFRTYLSVIIVVQTVAIAALSMP